MLYCDDMEKTPTMQTNSTKCPKKTRRSRRTATHPVFKSDASPHRSGIHILPSTNHSCVSRNQATWNYWRIIYKGGLCLLHECIRRF